MEQATNEARRLGQETRIDVACTKARYESYEGIEDVLVTADGPKATC